MREKYALDLFAYQKKMKRELLNNDNEVKKDLRTVRSGHDERMEKYLSEKDKTFREIQKEVRKYVTKSSYYFVSSMKTIFIHFSTPEAKKSNFSKLLKKRRLNP